MKCEHRERSWSTIIHDFIYVVEMYCKPTHRHLTVSFTGLDAYIHKKVKRKNKSTPLAKKQGYFHTKFQEDEPGETWLGKRSVGNVFHLSLDALPLSGTYQGDMGILKSLSSWSTSPPLPLWLWQPWHKPHLLLSPQSFISLWIFLVRLLICFAFSKVTFCIVL